MNSSAVDLAKLLARTLEKMVRSEGQPSVHLSADCVRVLAETISVVEQRTFRLDSKPAIASNGTTHDQQQPSVPA